jgi:Antitoxin Phd_YefM, type II toxin-antitoxin system
LTTLSSRQFNQDTGAAKRLAANGPVIITDRGKPAHVLLTIEEYEKIKNNRLTLFQAVAEDIGGDFEFDIPKLGDFGLRIPDFE